MIDLSWGGYSNGKLSISVLVAAAGGTATQYLEPTAAQKWAALRNACYAATGTWLQIASDGDGISSAYRDYANQQFAWNQWKYHGGDTAAVVGTSNHGWGRALDIDMDSLNAPGVWSWMQAHAGEYGWSWATGQASGERWHWESLTTPAGQVTSEDGVGWNYLSADWSWANGNTPSCAGLFGTFVCTARGNLGNFSLGSNGATLISWAAAHGLAKGYYFFNGNLNAKTCGVLFAQQALGGFVVGTSLILIDNEDEGSTGTHAWGPQQDLDFMAGVQSVRPDISNASFICYMNKDVNSRFNWSPCVNAGMGFMYARPGGPMDYKWWPNPMPTIFKQDGTVNGADADYHDAPWTVQTGGGGITRKAKSSMSTLYYTTVDDNPASQVEAFYLAGDGVGGAAWLPIYDPNLANQLAGFHSISQSSVFLSKATRDDWAAQYSSPIPTSGGSSTAPTIDYTALGKAVAAALPPATTGAAVDYTKIASVVAANNTAAATAFADALLNGLKQPTA